MLVDPNLKNDQRDAASRQVKSTAMLSLPLRGRIVLLVVAAVLCFGAYLFVASPSHYRAGEVVEKAATVLRTGDRVTVPEGSPVRGRLAIAPVAVKDIKRDVVLPAVVEADPGRTVKVLPPVAGRVVSLVVQLGERVAQGQELLVLDSGDLGAGFFRRREGPRHAFADQAGARPPARSGKSRRRRDQGSRAGESDYAQAQSEFDRAETRLRSIGVSADQVQKTRLLSMKAPIAGSVINLQVAPGAILNDTDGNDHDHRRTQTPSGLPPACRRSDTSLVFKGQPVDVVFTAYPGEVFKGQVLFVSDVVDPDTRRTKVRIAFDNPGTRLRPGMFANVSFYAPVQSVPVVPTSALVLKDDAQSGVRRNGAVDVRGAHRRYRLSAGRPGRSERRRQGRRPRRRQGRSAAR